MHVSSRGESVRRSGMRVVIANRGEIACRIARTVHSMGGSTVGVYTEADARSLHADSVDVAVAVPSYLDADAIIAAAQRMNATHVHPGYGFLAENAEFAEAVTDAGLVWIGPTPHQIRLLGDKIAAKQAAIDAGVPTTQSVEADPDQTIDHDALPPFPLLVKAAAGGGGRGMRIVDSPDDLDGAVRSAAREAVGAFGDGTVFVEPYIARGRHVEVQILGDTHGNMVHLGDRECSIQRRNQKIIEEAPSPGIDDATRAKLHDGAVALARAVGYVGAGTVEFMVSEPDRPGDEPIITFLEVNTRLQVEHPVTEAVTGIDLVEMQIGVANGHRLPFEQDDIGIDGHAIEVRLVAEDPTADWLPSTGTIARFDIDEADVRVDTGFRAGSEVSADYDSMLAKVIAHHPDRGVAALRLARALRTARISGVTTNIGMLVTTLTEPDFLAGATLTRYLDDHQYVLTDGGSTSADRDAHLIALVLVERERCAATNVTSFAPAGWRNLRTQGQRAEWMTGGEQLCVEYWPDGDGVIVKIGEPPIVTDDGCLGPDERNEYLVHTLANRDRSITIEIEGVRRVVDVELVPTPCTADATGTIDWQRSPRFTDPDAAAASGAGPVSPLPGTVIEVVVADGDTVSEGDVLMVVEAMKMEHRITAAADATVETVHVEVGDRVEAGQLLVTLGTDDD